MSKKGYIYNSYGRHIVKKDSGTPDRHRYTPKELKENKENMSMPYN